MDKIERDSLVLVIRAVNDYLGEFHDDIDARAIRLMLIEYIESIKINEK